MSAAPITPESIDLLEAQLNRAQKLLNGLTVTVSDVLETVAQLKELLFTTDEEESEDDVLERRPDRRAEGMEFGSGTSAGIKRQR